MVWFLLLCERSDTNKKLAVVFVVEMLNPVKVGVFFNYAAVFLRELAEQGARGLVIFGNRRFEKADTLAGIRVELRLEQATGHALATGCLRYGDLPNEKNLRAGGNAVS
jgi:hypothetical protein